MGKIPVNLETIGVSQAASISIDLDNLVRQSMIYLFDVKTGSGEFMDSYDDSYYEIGLPAADEGGAANLIRVYSEFQIKMMSFIFQQFLYMVSPIKTALQLPSLLSNPKKLVKKIKSIIKDIKKLLDDAIELFSKTKDWFINKFLEILGNLKIPIPSIEIMLIGIGIKLPEFGKKTSAFSDKTLERINNLRSKIKAYGDKITAMTNKITKLKNQLVDATDEMKSKINAQIARLNEKIDKYQSEIEELSDELTKMLSDRVTIILDKISTLKDKLKKLKDMANADLVAITAAMLLAVALSKKLLTNVACEETIAIYEYVIKYHEALMKKKDIINNHIRVMNGYTIIGTRQVANNTYPYCEINSINDIEFYKAKLYNFTEVNGIKQFNGTSEELYKIADRLIEVIDDEEQVINEFISNRTYLQSTAINKEFESIDSELKTLAENIGTEYKDLSETMSDIKTQSDSESIINEFLRTAADASIAAAILLIEEEIAELMDELKFLNPVEAWMETIKTMFIDFITAPFNIILSLITTVMEAITQFLSELPIVSFEKIKQFFKDLLGLAVLDKMSKMLENIIRKIVSLIPDPCPALENVMKFLPWLFVTIATEFVKSVASPLPIPV